MRGTAAVAGFVALLAMLVGTGDGQASFPGRNGEIVHSWSDVSGKALWSSTGVSAFKTRGKVRRNLFTCGWDNMHSTSDRNCDSRNAAVSANGKHVAVIRSGPTAATFRLVIITASGRELRSSPIDGPAYDLAWSPGGDTLLVTRYSSAHNLRGVGLPRLAVIDTHGREVATVAGDGASDADWAANGDIAYVQDGNLWTTRVGGIPRQLTTDGGSSPSWSPNGRSLAFVRSGRIWTVRANGSGERRLATQPAATPAWSPDGRYVAFVRPSGWMDRLGMGGIWVVRANGRCPHAIHGPESGFTGYGSPSWRALPGKPARRAKPNRCG
jgi:dipeptidyl aminopeptidase/acylaminoacyl peptidase